MIHTAQYISSAPDVKACPKSSLPEYAFIGRSNVGKSSLINMLTNQKGLAKTSSKPGKTLLINHFLVNAGRADAWHLVDLPGYGFAKAGQDQRERLKQMIERYCLGREQLVSLFVLVDCRLEPQKIDLQFMQWLGEQGIPFAIVFTKADKQSNAKTAASVKRFMQTLEEEWEELPPHFVTSAQSGLGRDELLDYIANINRSL